LLLAGCAVGHRWEMLHPPDVPDSHAPGGRRLLVTAPLDTWRVVSGHDSRAACDAARADGWNDALGRARERLGDDAPLDLDVRRAVHARCVGEPS